MTQETPTPVIGADVDWRDVPSGALVWPAASTHHDLSRAWLRLGGRAYQVAGTLGWCNRLGGRADDLPALIWEVVSPRCTDDRRRLTKVTIVSLGLTGRETSADLNKLAHDFEVGRILAHLKAAPCIACGKPPVCWGTAEGNRSIDPMCDECCAHGNEDGWCSALWDEHMTDLAAELAKAGFRLTDTSEQMYALLNPEADDE